MARRYDPDPLRWWEWEGYAEAPEPIVAVALLSSGNGWDWAKTPDDDSTTLWLTLSLRPVELYGELARRSVHYRVGSSRLEGRTVLSPSASPPVIADREVQTGQLVWLTDIEGQPAYRLLVLFIARREARFGRKRIWRLRDAAAAGYPLHDHLRLRRFGRIETDLPLTSSRGDKAAKPHENSGHMGHRRQPVWTLGWLA